MADIEKVIKGLKCHHVHENTINCAECPYYDEDKINCINDVLDDTLELLKEQQKEIENLKFQIHRLKYYGCYIP